ncbi:Aste57867_19139 [Aphanomyces stellatus]|uniref:Aste57867_19139 protein n=1 Tax=Aphanomyces stellatus TaxID=120398 RepID=A0A485LBV0_9STRA|nr:hypothetical protein As57867_019075 [Aphanomyces stellatus]VFT95862.1 Aste57867_19139 [Aphanomyces stellatus]
MVVDLGIFHIGHSGCGKTPVRTPKLFSAAHTDDLRDAIRHIRTRLGASVPLIGIGFSMGANILLKCVGEDATETTLTAAISVSNPYCFTSTYQHMTYSWLHRIVYNAELGKGLVRFFFEASNTPTQFENHPTVDIQHVRESKYISHYDNRLTRHVYGYNNVNEYYRDASCTPYIPRIAISVLCVTTLDDPVCPYVAIPYHGCETNPNVLLAATHTGGHIGFYTWSKMDMWSADVAVDYCKGVLQLVDEGFLPVHSKGNGMEAATAAN